MNRDRLRTLVLSLACCAAGLAVAAPASGRLVTVPLDRSGQVPGTIRLASRGELGTRGRGTVLVLDGTTRGRATRRLSHYADGLNSLGPRRVVTFDMRGTG